MKTIPAGTSLKCRVWLVCAQSEAEPAQGPHRAWARLWASSKASVHIMDSNRSSSILLPSAYSTDFWPRVCRSAVYHNSQTPESIACNTKSAFRLSVLGVLAQDWHPRAEQEGGLVPPPPPRACSRRPKGPTAS